MDDMNHNDHLASDPHAGHKMSDTHRSHDRVVSHYWADGLDSVVG